MAVTYVSGTYYYYQGVTDGVLVSSDNGSSWTQSLDLPGTYDSVNDLDVVGSSVYASSSDGTVYLSTDNGSTWSTESFTGGRISLSGSNVLRASGSQISLSTNSGSLSEVIWWGLHTKV